MSRDDGATSVGRSAVLGSEGRAARGGLCVWCHPVGTAREGVTVRTCLVMEEAAVLGGDILYRYALRASPC